MTLREMRRARDITGPDLAAALGVDVRTIYRWERGARRPSLAHVLALARALGVGPGEIVEATEGA